MDRALIDWQGIATSVFVTFMVALYTGGTPAVGIGDQGSLIFTVI